MDASTLLQHPAAAPHIERIRHELRRRTLRVQAVDRLTPGMLRITLAGEELAGFASLGFDDHVKVVVPNGTDEPDRRDYTPRRFDAEARTLVIDFAVHDAGPATRWALAARPGDTLQVGGPKGSRVISGDVRRWLLVGDETALPAIGRKVEEAGPGVDVTTVAAVADAGEHQAFDTRATLTSLWAHRPLHAAADPAALLATVRQVPLEAGTFVWIAAEATVARAVRDHFLHDRGHPAGWIKAAGYWAMGRSDTHSSIE